MSPHGQSVEQYRLAMSSLPWDLVKRGQPGR